MAERSTGDSAPEMETVHKSLGLESLPDEFQGEGSELSLDSSLQERLVFRHAQGLLAGLTGCSIRGAGEALVATSAHLGVAPGDMAGRFFRFMALGDEDYAEGLALGLAARTSDGRITIALETRDAYEAALLLRSAYESDRGALSRAIKRAQMASPLDAVEAVTRELSVSLGATEVSFLVASLSGRGLVRLTRVYGENKVLSGQDCADELHQDSSELDIEVPADGVIIEQVLKSQTIQSLSCQSQNGTEGFRERWRILAPVSERGEVLGVLEMFLPFEPAGSALDDIADTAHLLALVVIANRRHTDLFEIGERGTAFSLPAEIQRRLLPPSLTCEGGSFTLSAWLEPAGNVGGDTFDYSLDREILHLSITDAMGHGISSALNATLCVGSLRNSRRSFCSLTEQAAVANQALAEYAESTASEGFVTGILGRVDLRTGLLVLVNAGHVAPYIARGSKVSKLKLPRGLPFGLFHGTQYGSSQLGLESGDRLVLVTDGLLEDKSVSLDIEKVINESRDMHPREATRFIAGSVLAAADRALIDDATILVVDWHGVRLTE